MKNIKLIISYDGTKYNGWQKQGNTSNTIQEKLEETIKRLLNEDIELAGSGRTDAGVHALRQVANFHVSKEALDNFYNNFRKGFNAHYVVYEKHDMFDAVRDELNRYLPKDIRILKASEAKERFHSRLNAKGKHYSYRIDNGKVANIFERKYMTRVEGVLDIEKMRQGVTYLIGEHDFKSFCANKKMKKSTVRTIQRIEITAHNGIIKIDFYGNGFLYNMIRIMVGTLIEIGLSKRAPEEMENIIEAKDRSKAGYLAPAAGLFLEELYY